MVCKTSNKRNASKVSNYNHKLQSIWKIQTTPAARIWASISPNWASLILENGRLYTGSGYKVRGLSLASTQTQTAIGIRIQNYLILRTTSKNKSEKENKRDKWDILNNNEYWKKRRHLSSSFNIRYIFNYLNFIKKVHY